MLMCPAEGQDVVRQISGQSSHEQSDSTSRNTDHGDNLTCLQNMKQRLRPVGTSLFFAGGVLALFNYGLKGFDTENQPQHLALAALAYVLSCPLKDYLGTGQRRTPKAIIQEYGARAITPFSIVLGSGVLYDNTTSISDAMEVSFIGDALGHLFGSFGKELGSKVVFSTSCWTMKVLLSKLTGFHKISYNDKDFNWSKFAPELLVNWGIQVSFIAFASHFKEQGHKTETSLFYTSEIIIFLVHALFLIGLEDMLEAGLKKCCCPSTKDDEKLKVHLLEDVSNDGSEYNANGSV